MLGNLEVSHISKSFGGVQAVNDVSFVVAAGELLALIGPNGAGKTTCFNMLNGQLRPDGGSIRFDGKELVGMQPREVWKLGVGRTFQITATFGSMTVRENVQMALISHRKKLFSFLGRARKESKAEADALLERCGARGPGGNGRVTYWHTATSSVSNLPWRLPTSRVCCSWTNRPPEWRRRSALA